MRHLAIALLLAACGTAEANDASTTLQAACDPCPGAIGVSVFPGNDANGTETCVCPRRPTWSDRCTNCGPLGCGPALAFSLNPIYYSCTYTQTAWTRICAEKMPCCSVLHGDGSHVGDLVGCICDSSC